MCDVWPSWWQTIYFCCIIFAFQFGWPTVQVSHLAIIPELANTQRDRNQLTSLRYSAQFMSNIITFIITDFVLSTGRASTNEKIGPNDFYRFRVSMSIGHNLNRKCDFILL